MAEISTRAVATAAAGAMLAVGLAFVSNADASHGYDRAVRCNGQTVRQVQYVERSREGAIFRKRKPGPGGRRVSVAYGCLVRSGPVTRLGFANRIRDPRLAGRYAGYRRILYLTEFGSASGMTVVDLKTGRATVDEAGVPGSEGDSHVQSFALKRTGGVAWIGGDETLRNFSVWKVDAAASGVQQLDSGQQIDDESMRLSADRRSVSWRNGSAERSAPLF